jgi:hypothetical protein
MPEQQLSLDGIPEPVARAIEVVAQMARSLAATNNGLRREELSELPKWDGSVIGTLSRSEMYDDV